MANICNIRVYDPSLLDEIVDLMEFSCIEELLEEYEGDLFYVASDLEENGEEELSARLTEALNNDPSNSTESGIPKVKAEEISRVDNEDPSLFDEIADFLGFGDRDNLLKSNDFSIDDIDALLRAKYLDNGDKAAHRLRMRLSKVFLGDDQLKELEPQDPDLYYEVVTYCSKNSWCTDWFEVLAINEDDGEAKALKKRLVPYGF